MEIELTFHTRVLLSVALKRRLVLLISADKHIHMIKATTRKHVSVNKVQMVMTALRTCSTIKSETRLVAITKRQRDCL